MLKRELSNLNDDFKIVDEELELCFDCDIDDLENGDESWERSFYNDMVDCYDECENLEEFKDRVSEIYENNSVW
jgi:hypothetical protein